MKMSSPSCQNRPVKRAAKRRDPPPCAGRTSDGGPADTVAKSTINVQNRSRKKLLTIVLFPRVESATAESLLAISKSLLDI